MIDSLIGIRFFFAVLIFLNHCNFLKYSESLNIFFENYLHGGAYSVTFFFVLSGFVISLGYKDKFISFTKRQLFLFYKKRFIKLYPMYIISMFLSFFYKIILSVVNNQIIWKEQIYDIILSIFLFQSITLTKARIGNAACWFISCIFILYFITPFIVYLIFKLTNYKVGKLIASFFILYGIYVLFIYNLLHSEVYTTYKDYLYTSPFLRFFEYVYGIIFGLIFCHIRSSDLKEYKYISNIIQIVSLILSAYTYFYCIHTREVYDSVLLLPVFSFLIFSLCFNNGFLFKLFSLKPILSLGKLSMYIYIYHFMVINYGGKQILLFILGKSNLALISILFLCLFFSILLSYYTDKLIVYIQNKLNS